MVIPDNENNDQITISPNMDRNTAALLSMTALTKARTGRPARMMIIIEEVTKRHEKFRRRCGSAVLKFSECAVFLVLPGSTVPPAAS